MTTETSNTTPLPKHARDMSAAEYRAALADMKRADYAAQLKAGDDREQRAIEAKFARKD